MTAALVIAHCLVAAGVALHAILNRPSPRSAVIWVLVLWFIPVLGVSAYATIGLDRVRARRALLKGRTREELRGAYPEVPALASARRVHRVRTGDPLVDLHAVAGQLSQRELLAHNEFALLRNGEEIYPAMLADIAAAHTTINCFSYCFEGDEVGERFVDELARAVERGVEVRVCYDAAGSVGTPGRFFARARARGIRVAPFFPLNPLARRAQLYLRNHRKLLVVDGVVGYFGGANIGAIHLAASDRPDRSIDLHVRARGPIVQQLQEVFIEDWFYAAGEELLTAAHFADVEDAGDAVGRVLTGGPDHEYDHVRLLFFQALSSARQSIRIATPYFIPDPALKTALRAAALRGLDVRLYVPSRNDHPIIRRASLALMPSLLTAGMRAFEQPPPFVHTKALLIDDNWALLGSANMDPRSFHLNYEVVVEMSRTPLIADLRAWFDACEGACTELTADLLARRSFGARVVDHGAALFSPLM